MDRRTVLAVLLTAGVIVVTPLLFPPPRVQRLTVADSPAPRAGARDSAVGASAASDRRAPAAPSAPRAVSRTAETPGAAPHADSVTIRTNRAIFRLVSPGGVPGAVTLPEYRSLRPGVPEGTPVELIESGDRLFRLSYRDGAETISLDTVRFRFAAPRREGDVVIQALTSTSLARPLTLTYRFVLDSFSLDVSGALATRAGASDGQITISLPRRLHSEEADARDDAQQRTVAYHMGSTDVKSITLRSLDTVPRVDTGAVRWVAARNKYFVAAAIAGGDMPFRTVAVRAMRDGDPPTAAQTLIRMSTRGGQFAFRVFAGPQAWKHLRATAAELENVNPYGGFLHGVVQPFATIVMRLLLWMRDTVNVGYGWVLVIFGVVVRLLMWPLNQNAMRSSLKLQRIQPQLTELQARYKNDPERQRDAMLRLYQEHGMSPFSPVLGCLPMMLPMPILFALYFVFQNTIELRGVSFLWLPDLSLHDPYYVTPLFMGASMFLLSWIGMRGMPPSPQSKMMAYVMPVMFTALFWKFASGLNLYYAVQNVAALPQQWLLARERTMTKSDDAKKPGGAKGPPGA